MEILIGYLTVFLIQWVITYGILFAHLQRKWPTIAKEAYQEDRKAAIGFAAGFSLVPLISILVLFFVADWFKYGLKFK